MYGFNWENQNALISEIIPLPPCLSSELGFDETLYCTAISDLHRLKSCEPNSIACDSIASMINPTNTINQSIIQDKTSVDHTRNPNFRKRYIEENPKLKASSQRVPQRFEIVFESSSRSKKRKTVPCSINQSSSINFSLKNSDVLEPDEEAMAEVKDMIYMEAAMRPINLGFEEPIQKPKRKNVRISNDPQTVSARMRRERISERLRVLQRLVPGGDKLDTCSMLDEAVNYVKFLQNQVKELEIIGHTLGNTASFVFNPMQSVFLSSLPKP